MLLVRLDNHDDFISDYITTDPKFIRTFLCKNKNLSTNMINVNDISRFVKYTDSVYYQRVV